MVPSLLGVQSTVCFARKRGLHASIRRAQVTYLLRGSFRISRILLAYDPPQYTREIQLLYESSLRRQAAQYQQFFRNVRKLNDGGAYSRRKCGIIADR